MTIGAPREATVTCAHCGQQYHATDRQLLEGLRCSCGSELKTGDAKSKLNAANDT